VVVVQKTKIEWTNAVWNPCDGCLYGCKYCYARKYSIRFKNRFPNGFIPTLHEERLIEPYLWKKSKVGNRTDKIFTCSMGDFFGKGMKRAWQEKVLKVIRENPDLTFQILTKQPQLIPQDIDYPKNLHIGVSVTNNSDVWRMRELTSDRMMKCHKSLKFVSFEPLFENIFIPSDIKFDRMGWVIVGIQTNPTVVIPYEFIDRIYFYANSNGIPVFCKNSIIENYPQITKENQQYPVI
jgi:protein gp37